MQRAGYVSGFDWSFDSRIAIEAIQIPREIPRGLAAFVESEVSGWAGLDWEDVGKYVSKEIGWIRSVFVIVSGFFVSNTPRKLCWWKYNGVWEGWQEERDVGG
jgi:hypothetical protein